MYWHVQLLGITLDMAVLLATGKPFKLADLNVGGLMEPVDCLSTTSPTMLNASGVGVGAALPDSSSALF